MLASRLISETAREDLTVPLINCNCHYAAAAAFANMLIYLFNVFYML